MSTQSTRQSISSYLKSALDYLETMQAMREFDGHETKKQQLNLRLSTEYLNGLDKLASHYDDNRTSVATMLLQAAIADVCEYLNIDWRVYTREELEARGVKVQE